MFLSNCRVDPRCPLCSVGTSVWTRLSKKAQSRNEADALDKNLAAQGDNESMHGAKFRKATQGSNEGYAPHLGMGRQVTLPDRPVRRCLGSIFMMLSSCTRNPMSSSLSASSNTITSKRFRLMRELRCMTSRRRPGVPISTWAPLAANSFASAAGSLHAAMQPGPLTHAVV